ncbi:hypothetical protein OAT67_09220 [Bacteriovoracaceae bacterium]|nr:hypothetical protein [Bacteriovoracaceae bacterium]
MELFKNDKWRKFMIFPLEQDYLSWSEKYNIRIKTAKCPKCGVDIITNIPFAIKGYRGLKSDDHGCGEKYTRKVIVPTSKDEKEFWSKIAGAM